ALADDVVEPEALPELLAQRLVLHREAALLQSLVDGEQDLLVLERLRDVVERPFAHRLDGALDRRVGGDHDHHLVRPALADLLEHLHAAHAGEHQVEEDEVDVLALQDLDRLLAGPRRDGPVPLLADEHGEDVLQNLLVVDDQDVHAEVSEVSARAPPAPWRGSSTMKQAPSPGSLSTRSVPPWRRTISELMDSPSPVPPRLSLVE